MKTYTCFCREADGTGTTWIDTLTVADRISVTNVKRLAVLRCAEDWDYHPSEVVCIGVLEGAPNLLFWQDIDQT